MPINPRPMLQELYVLPTYLPACLQTCLRLPPPTCTAPTASSLLSSIEVPRLTASRVNKDIVVRLKWGETEYKGRLVSTDSYMNIQLTNAQEFIDQKFTSDLGQILIRCNNVLWIKSADQGDGPDTKMEG
jgi:small nuclear ribonucleoprotein F